MCVIPAKYHLTQECYLISPALLKNITGVKKATGY
jgi:hypothetical protein